MRDETIDKVRKEVKQILPDGLQVGVIPPDGTQLSLTHWLIILEIDPEDGDNFLKQLRTDGFKPKRYCRNPFIPARFIRQQIDNGNGE